VPLPSSQGARKLKMPIRQAMVPSVLRRPTRSASQPDSMMAPRQKCTDDLHHQYIGHRLIRVHEIQDSGNTVTRWNSAKLASAAKAPIITLRPSLAIKL
jgi:hypothetical protein